MVYERRKAYAEVDMILQCLPNEYLNKIPKKIINLFRTQKLTDYKINIDKNNPIDKNKLSEMSLAILASLNYRYWCPNEKVKGELCKKYLSNNEKYEKKIEERYKINNLFENKKIEKKQNNKTMQALVKYEKKTFMQKILSSIRKFFKKN